MECAQSDAVSFWAGVGWCLWLVAADETSPASGVERRCGAGRSLFGGLRGAGRQGGNVTGGGCGKGFHLGISARGQAAWSLFGVGLSGVCLC